MISLIKRVFGFGVYSAILLCFGIALCNLFIYVSARPYIYDDAEKTPVVSVALVPGAAIKGEGELSSIFKARVDAAITLYKEKKVSKILVSGDNSSQSYNEVKPARVLLIENGIPDEDIFLDYAGFDTYSSMYRAREIFGVSSLIVTTQSFHLPRAVFIGRQLGIDAFGVRADIPNLLFRNYVRESLAAVKAVLDLMFQKEPKFLGDRIPITGDGREYR